MSKTLNKAQPVVVEMSVNPRLLVSSLVFAVSFEYGDNKNGTTNSKLKSGEMTIQELPFIAVSMGIVPARNNYSLISAGTKARRSKHYGKARERPQQVK